MAINFDNSQSSKVTLQASGGCSVLKFPINNKVNNILTSGFAGISNVSGLSNCISNLQSKFYYTNDINSNCSYSYATDSGSIAQVYNSFIFGSNGIAKSNYYNNSQIVHSINAFNCKGGAQNTTVLSKVCTFNNNSTEILSGIIDQNTILFNCFDIIGKSFTSENCFAVFNIKNNIIRGTGSCVRIGYCNLITGASCNLHQNFSLEIIGGNDCSWNINVCNASGIQWLTRASILEVYATGNENFPVSTFATYWKCTNNCTWFNLSNWFSDQYITTALSYPTPSTNVVMSGNCAAFVDIDCNLWLEPNSIDTTRITDAKGICLYSDAGNSFSGNIYGNVTLFGSAVFGNPVQGIHWTNQQDINWFNLSNWYLDSSLQNLASKLPLKTSDVFTYGNSGVCINLDCNLWVQPHSIDATNSTADPSVKVCIYSENSRSFSGIVYGGVTLYGNASFS